MSSTRDTRFPLSPRTPPSSPRPPPSTQVQNSPTIDKSLIKSSPTHIPGSRSIDTTHKRNPLRSLYSSNTATGSHAPISHGSSRRDAFNSFLASRSACSHSMPTPAAIKPVIQRTHLQRQEPQNRALVPVIGEQLPESELIPANILQQCPKRHVSFNETAEIINSDRLPELKAISMRNRDDRKSPIKKRPKLQEQQTAESKAAKQKAVERAHQRALRLASNEKSRDCRRQMQGLMHPRRKPQIRLIRKDHCRNGLQGQQ